jgi:hypothetical protein
MYSNVTSKEQAQVRKDLKALCSYAKSAAQYQEIEAIVDTLEGNILHRIEQMENTLALNKIVLDGLIGEMKDHAGTRLVIDTYDEEGKQD